MEDKYVALSDTDDTSENEEYSYLLKQIPRLTAVSNPDEPLNCDNAVYSQLVPFQDISTSQGKS